METLSLYIAKFCVQTSNFCSVGNRTYILSYSHFRKLHVCTLFFLYLVFGSKIREIDHIVIPSEVVCLRPYPPQFLKNGHVPPHPFHTMIQQSKTIILCSICTIQTLRTATSCFTKVSSLCRNFLIFVSGGKGGMLGLSRALEPAQGSKVASGRLLLLPVTKKGLFLGP